MTYDESNCRHQETDRVICIANLLTAFFIKGRIVLPGFRQSLPENDRFTDKSSDSKGNMVFI